jgi:hypothetical protein
MSRSSGYLEDAFQAADKVQDLDLMAPIGFRICMMYFGQGDYLKLAQRFNHMAVLGPAAQGVDKLTGLHANTQIPKFVGTARQFELTGQDWLKAAGRSEFSFRLGND